LLSAARAEHKKKLVRLPLPLDAVDWNAEMEWSRYLTDAHTNFNPISGDVLKWWSEHEQQYPAIACVARDWLAQPSSTASAERYASVGSRTVTPDRSNLSAETTSLILTTTVNIKFLRSVGQWPEAERAASAANAYGAD
jgi:hypothetical protein